jgi:hypothetical protein
MVTIVVPLADLKLFSAFDSKRDLSTREIVASIREQFDYLPGDVQVEIRDEMAVICFEETSAQRQAEARRLFA